MGKLEKMMKITAAICFFCLCLVQAAAQNTPYSFQHFSVKDGLSQSSVVAIAQDSTGFMWFATQDGLNRYDGRRFIYYEKYFDDITNAQNNRLGKIYVDRGNDVWILPNTHIPEKYNRYKEVFTPLSGMKNISCMLQDKPGNYWFGSFGNQVTKIDTRNRQTLYQLPLTPVKEPNSIHQLFEDGHGMLWLAARSGLYQFDHSSQDFIPVSLPGNAANVYCVAEDLQETIWVGCLGKGLFFRRKYDTAFQPFAFNDKDLVAAVQASGLIIESIAVDRENNIWVGTYGNGLLIINGDGRIVTRYLPDRANPHSFNYKDVLCVLTTHDHLVWLGTDGGGINLYDKSYTKFNAFTTGTVPPGIAVDIVRCIYKDKAGNTWLGTSGKGLTRYNPQLPTPWKTWLYEKDVVKTANNSNRVISLYEDEDGLIWMGTQGNGLMFFDKATEQFRFFSKQPALPDKTIWCLYPADNGNVWAGTEDSGLCLLNKITGILKQAITTTDNKNNTPVKNIRCITKISDTILCLGTDDAGLFSYNIRQHRLSAFSLPAGVSTGLQKIKSLFYDTASQMLFIGTNGNGMTVYNLNSMKLSTYTIQNGLPNNVVYGIVPGTKNTLWLSTNKGLCSFSLPADQASAPAIHLYDERDGLQNTEFNTGAHFKDSKGYIYFGGIDGFNYFFPEDITNSPATGNIVFTDCTIAGKQYSGDSAIETRHVLTLKPGENEFSLSFALLNYSTPRQLNYQYQLKGYDKRWINAGNNNIANYTNLAPGIYRFFVTASNNDGSTITSPAMLSIVVKPMFYQTLWFRVLSITALCLLIYWFIYRRIQTVRKQEQLKQMRTVAEMKALRAQMNPHFIFNCLNAIDNLIQTNQKDKATTYLARFARLIRNVLDSSKNNMVSFTKDYDTLVLYLSLEQFRLNNKFEYKIIADDELLHADYKVPPLIIQPFVENAIHHGLMNKNSADKKLTITMQLENEFIRYSIVDNGVGRKSAGELNNMNKPEHSSYGIEISRERAALHNNHKSNRPPLIITDLEENGEPAGTKVEMWIAV